jgi:hypothetical protein
MKQYFMHFMLILFYASFYFMFISCSYQHLNVAAATFTGAAATIAAALIAAASVAAVSVAEETENCMGKEYMITKITALAARISAAAAAAVAAIAIAATAVVAAIASCDAVRITLHQENCSFAK